MKWIKRIALGLVSVIVLLVAVIFGVSESRFRKTYDVSTVASLNVTRDSAQIARGEHLVTAVAKCNDCHTADLGGKIFIEPGPMGTVSASNLTTGKGGVLASYTDAQLETAIRHGVGQNRRGLVIMPSDAYQNLGDADVSAIIAYLRSLPPVDRELPATRLGPVGRLLVTVDASIIPATSIDHKAPPASRATVPPVGPTLEYGEYLVNVGGCRGCHSPNLAGGPGHGGPDAPNITPGGAIGQWSEADFTRALRTGTRPDGTTISESMPWKGMAHHTDDELHALWLYLKTVTPVQPAPAKS